MFKFNEPICYGRLIKRYKRFFMDVKLDSGEIITAHVPNTGSMLGLLDENNLLMLTKSLDDKRKTSHTVQSIKIGDSWVGVNTHLPNKLIKQSLGHSLLNDFLVYEEVKSEVLYGRSLHSRSDLYFSKAIDKRPNMFVEIKNVTMKNGSHAQFPDTKSDRACKHITELMWVMECGLKAGVIFVIQRQDIDAFSIAKHIDARFFDLLLLAQEKGLYVKALVAILDEQGLYLSHCVSCLF
jgi:sugar fermentation stimulation protein A